MEILKLILLTSLLVCAVSVSLTKNLLTSVIIYLAYSLVMSIVWLILQSPDLAITEAAVGAGISGMLFFVTLKKIHMIDAVKAQQDAEHRAAPSEKEENREKDAQ